MALPREVEAFILLIANGKRRRNRDGISQLSEDEAAELARLIARYGNAKRPAGNNPQAGS